MIKANLHTLALALLLPTLLHLQPSWVLPSISNAVSSSLDFRQAISIRNAGGPVHRPTRFSMYICVSCLFYYTSQRLWDDADRYMAERRSSLVDFERLSQDVFLGLRLAILLGTGNLEMLFFYNHDALYTILITETF